MFIRDFGLDTITLAGALPGKLQAIREAGFSQVMLSARDLAGHAGGIDDAVACVRSSTSSAPTSLSRATRARASAPRASGRPCSTAARTASGTARGSSRTS